MTYEELKKRFVPMNEDEQLAFFAVCVDCLEHSKDRKRYEMMEFICSFWAKTPPELAELGVDVANFNRQNAQDFLSELKAKTGYVNDDFILNYTGE